MSIWDEFLLRCMDKCQKDENGAVSYDDLCAVVEQEAEKDD